MYISAPETLAPTKVEKLKPADRNCTSGMPAALTSVETDVTSWFHVPFPTPLLASVVFDGWKLHSVGADEVEHDPAKTEISPEDATDGMKTVSLSLRNGRFEDSIFGEIVADSWADMFSEASWYCALEPGSCRKMYAMLPFVEGSGRRTVVGL